MDIKKIQQYIDRTNKLPRKHANFFDSHDKNAKELVIAQDFLQKLGETTGEFYAEPEKAEDPPDFRVKTSADECIGIEITELVDEEAINFDISGNTSDYHEKIMSWDKDKTITRLTEIIREKDQKCSKKQNLYKSIILLIHTDEPELPPDRLKQYINGHNWDKKGFDKVYILIAYDPKDGKKHLILF